MSSPDFERARQYALDRLERELSPALVYHSLVHTRDDVGPAAERLADLEGVTGEARLLLLTAAYFHDIGFTLQREDHEALGAGIVREVLPGFGYSPEQVEAVASLLLATRLPQQPKGLLEAILNDADLDVLGRDDFWTRQLDLRSEWSRFGQATTDHEWYVIQLAFQREHQYFTEAARRLRSAKKLEIVARLAELADGQPDGA